jgi:hypothetical protein
LRKRQDKSLTAAVYGLPGNRGRNEPGKPYCGNHHPDTARWFDEIMSEKESPAMKALRIVYGDEVIVVQCVPRQVVKGRVLIKVYPDCRVVASVPPETPEHEVLSALKKKSLDIPATA